MPTHTSATDHSPLSKWALTVKQLEPGRRVIIFNIYRGILLRGTFVTFDEDSAEDGGSTSSKLVFEWDDPIRGNADSWCAEDAGLQPYSDGHWHPTNFVIKNEDFVNLPRVISQQRS